MATLRDESNDRRTDQRTHRRPHHACRRLAASFGPLPRPSGSAQLRPAPRYPQYGRPERRAPQERSARHERRGTQWLRLRRLALVLLALVLAAPLVVPGVANAAVSASPVAPPGATGLQDILNWTLYGGMITCAATVMYGFAKMGISHSQQSYQGANHGKSVVILGLLGALGLGLTTTIVNGLTSIH